MNTSVETDDSVAGWLDDFHACLAGTHGYAWRARAEQELRRGSLSGSAEVRAAGWARNRLEILGSAVA